MLPLRVLTCSTQFAGLGGVESILQGHHRHDDAYGLDSRFVCFWETPSDRWPRVKFLDFNIHLRLRAARQRFSSSWSTFAPEIAVYHTEWGLPYFADLDRAPRRVLYLHSDVPGLDELLKTRRLWVDGFLCVSDQLVDRVRRLAPDLSIERILKVDAALEVPPLPDRPPRAVDAPIVLGFCGRIATQQKRVDRFPDLVRQLYARGLNFRLEFLGDGDELNWLQAQLQGFPWSNRFQFHGRQRGAEYWQTIGRWDAILFVSDYEGTPLAELEAMALGVVPFHPLLQSGGDFYAGRVAPQCVYPPGDLLALSERIHWLSQRTWAERVALGKLARTAMSAHLGDAYRRQFTAFLRRITELPLRAQPPERGPWWGNWLTFGQRKKLASWRRRWS